MPEDELAKVKALAAESGLSVSEIIRACVRRAMPYVEQKIRERLQ